MLAELESLTSQNDATKRELAMSQDTARTYYEKMVKAQAEAAKSSDPAVVNLTINRPLPLGPD